MNKNGTMSRVSPGYAMPKMGEAALELEAKLFSQVSAICPIVQGVTGGKGTGIMTYRDGSGRVFKLELTQVAGNP